MQYQLLNNWLSKQDSNQSMHFICIAFSRRKTRAKLRRARSGEFTARNSMSGGRRAGCYSDQVYRGRASGFQGAEPTGLPPHSTHSRLSTNLPPLQRGAVPVMFAPLDARSMNGRYQTAADPLVPRDASDDEHQAGNLGDRTRLACPTRPRGICISACATP